MDRERDRERAWQTDSQADRDRDRFCKTSDPYSSLFVTGPSGVGGFLCLGAPTGLFTGDRLWSQLFSLPPYSAQKQSVTTVNHHSDPHWNTQIPWRQIPREVTSPRSNYVWKVGKTVIALVCPVLAPGQRRTNGFRNSVVNLLSN